MLSFYVPTSTKTNAFLYKDSSDIAIAYYDGNKWISEGWWHLSEGYNNVLNCYLNQRYYYFHIRNKSRIKVQHSVSSHSTDGLRLVAPSKDYPFQENKIFYVDCNNFKKSDGVQFRKWKFWDGFTNWYDFDWQRIDIGEFCRDELTVNLEWQEYKNFHPGSYHFHR